MKAARLMDYFLFNIKSDMNTVQINEAVKSAQNIGWQMSEFMGVSLKEMNNPQYRIIFAGEFQVGKSLMADAAFLNGVGLLKSGIGIPTTSVVTEIIYGDQLTMFVNYKGSHAPVVISNPEADDIARYTTAESEEERTLLSEKIEKVVISVTDTRLKKYAVMDSPGIDDANESVMINSTYPQIMTADAVVLVIPPRSLDSIEKNFLQSFLFDKSISRLMIMISYNPRRPIGKRVREELIRNIKTELQMMGRGYIPVNICCYDESVDEELNAPEKIREAIDAFATENVEQGRLLRVAGCLLHEWGTYENELRARLELVGANKEKIRELEAKLEQAEKLLSDRLVSAKARIATRESDITVSMIGRIQQTMKVLKRSLMSRFDQCKELGDVQVQLTAVKNDMEYSIKKMFEQETSTARTQMEEVLSMIDTELAAASDELVRTLDFGYSINSGHLGKLNPKFLTIMDYLTAVVISPFALGADIIIRYILGKLPLIRNLLPAVFVKNQVVKTIDESIQDICSKVVSDIADQFKQSFKRIDNDLNAHFKLLYQRTVMPIHKAIQEARENQLSPSQVAELKHKLDTICLISERFQADCK